MKPAWFDYRCPADLAEGLEILQHAGPDARVLAGGQSLMPMMNMRVVAPTVLVDINRMSGLCGIAVDGDVLRIGAQVRHNDVLNDARVRAGWPMLPEAIAYVAHPA